MGMVTAKEVVEAIDRVVALLGATASGPLVIGGARGLVKQDAAILTAHRASLLEGGSDAPLPEKGGRLSAEEREAIVCAVAAVEEMCRGHYSLIVDGQDESLATLRRMLADTSGGAG